MIALDEGKLISAYTTRYKKYLKPLCSELEHHISTNLNDYPRLDKVVARAKKPASFITKALTIEDGSYKYSDPLSQILDQLGARIVTFYLEDVSKIKGLITDYYSPLESKTLIPDSINEFGYEGHHFTLLIPDDLLSETINDAGFPLMFELQIKTLFQHAWAEADHDLAYKPPVTLSKVQKRNVAFSAAQAWGADKIFSELANELIFNRENSAK